MYNWRQVRICVTYAHVPHIHTYVKHVTSVMNTLWSLYIHVQVPHTETTSLLGPYNPGPQVVALDRFHCTSFMCHGRVGETSCFNSLHRDPSIDISSRLLICVIDMLVNNKRLLNEAIYTRYYIRCSSRFRGVSCFHSLC